MERFGRNSKDSLGARGILTLATLALALIAATTAGLQQAWSKSSAVALSGEIQDSTCAGTAAHVEKECAERCVRNGAKWVLYDRAKGDIYQLDDQERASGFAAQSVIVVGSLDKSNGTIHVVSIKGA